MDRFKFFRRLRRGDKGRLMSDRNDTPSLGIVGGVVRGEVIHGRCATDEEMTLTWGRFYQEGEADDLICARCGLLLGENP